METEIDYSFSTFQKNAIIRFLGLDKYQYLCKHLYEVDISKDIDGYQKSFNAFSVSEEAKNGDSYSIVFLKK